MKKIISAADTRPEFIKIAAIFSHLSKFFHHFLLNTGQHYDYQMSKIFFEELFIPEPAYNLGIGSASHGKQTGKMLAGIEMVLQKEKPDLVIVYGDTNTTLAGALAAVKLKIPVAHVEAGMRSYDRTMPEEINRVIVDHISTLFFCPSKTGVDNLAKEGIAKNVFFTGDVMYDVFLEVRPDEKILNELRIKPKNYYFATIHRAGNTDDLTRLKQLLSVLDSLDKTVIFPIHPRTKKAILPLKLKFRKTRLIKPVKFADSIALQSQAAAVITDSGGVQKEAYWLKVPCFTLRDTTEWPETVETGWNFLVLNELEKLPTLVKQLKKPTRHPSFYGTGSASSEIAKIMRKFLYD